MIELSNTRFIRIDGTEVHVLAANDAEARIALKELRLKKRELLHYKRRLQMCAKAIEARDQRQHRTGTSPDMSPYMGPGAYVARSLGAVMHLATGWNPFLGAPLPTTRDAVTQDLATLEEVTLNLEAAMLHIEGKLASGG